MMRERGLYNDLFEKDEFSNTVNKCLYKCWEILKNKSILSNDVLTDPCSELENQLGEKMADILIDFINKLEKVDEDLLFNKDEIFEEVEQMDQDFTSESGTIVEL